jgi:predicted permease
MSREPRFTGLRRVLQLRVGARGVEHEIDAELQFHLDARIDELMARGIARDEAMRIAHDEFGDLDEARRDLVTVDRRRHAHEQRADWGEALAQDVRLALRRMRAAPGLTLAIVVTLALGIGTNAAMFQIADRLLFEPPSGVVDPQRLATMVLHVHSPFEIAQGVSIASTYPNFSELAPAPALDGLAVYDWARLTVGLRAAAWRAPVEFVSANYFTLLGAHPERGRLFSLAADSSAATPGVVISDQLWRTRLGQNPNAIGTLLRVGRASYPIVGIAAPGFTGVGLEAVDLWLPADQAAGLGVAPEDWRTHDSWWLSAVVRLKPGASLHTAESQLTTELRRLTVGDPGVPTPNQARDSVSTVQLAPLSGLRDDDASRSPAARVAAWLAVLSALVLVIACANVAGLLLVRSLRRSREFALRRALGMSRLRLTMQLFVESSLLAILGALAATLALHWTTPLLRNLVAPRVAWTAVSVRSDLMLAGATLAGVLIMACASSLVPARILARGDVGSELKPMGHTAPAGRSRAHAVLVGAQIAICLVLLAVAGVFVQSLRRVRTLDYGLNLDLIAAELRLPAGGAGAAADARLDQAVSAVQRLPGVLGVAIADASPFHSMIGGGIELPGRPRASLPQSSSGSYAAHVSPGYFNVTGTPIVRGRGFVASDTLAGAAPVLIVSESMAKLYWPGSSPIGQCAYVDRKATCSTIIGVARDQLRMFVTEDPRLEIFLPLAGGPATSQTMTLLVHAANPAAAQPMIRRALQQLDPSTPFADVATLRSRLDPQTQSWLLGASMMSGFAVLALVLAALGLYGAVSYMVASRAHEIGVRLAIGAPRTSVVTLFVRRGLRITLIGLLVGGAGSFFVTRRLSGLLFHTSPADPAALGTAGGVLILVAILASVIPSSRAARLDPLETLRVE